MINTIATFMISPQTRPMPSGGQSRRENSCRTAEWYPNNKGNKHAQACQPVHRSTAIWTHGPSGGLRPYSGYRSCSRRAVAGGASWIEATPSARTHHSSSQSSERWSNRTATLGFAAMFSIRRRGRPDLGLSSTAKTMRSPTVAWTIGTACGRPSTPTVARVANLVAAARERQSSISCLATPCAGSCLRQTSGSLPGTRPLGPSCRKQRVLPRSP
jgi:hypothetical protein